MITALLLVACGISDNEKRQQEQLIYSEYSELCLNTRWQNAITNSENACQLYDENASDLIRRTIRELWLWAEGHNILQSSIKDVSYLSDSICAHSYIDVMFKYYSEYAPEEEMSEEELIYYDYSHSSLVGYENLPKYDEILKYFLMRTKHNFYNRAVKPVIENVEFVSQENGKCFWLVTCDDSNAYLVAYVKNSAGTWSLMLEDRNSNGK